MRLAGGNNDLDGLSWEEGCPCEGGKAAFCLLGHIDHVAPFGRDNLDDERKDLYDLEPFSFRGRQEDSTLCLCLAQSESLSDPRSFEWSTDDPYCCFLFLIWF